MTDTFPIGQVDGCDLVGGEEDAVLAVRGARPDGDALAAEGLWNRPQPSLEADVVLGGRDRAHDLMLIIFDLGKTIRHRAVARPIAACRCLLAERLVRPFEIINPAPLIEGALDVDEPAERAQREHLGLEGAVEALVLAAALRMIRPAVDELDAELEQPDSEPREVLAEASPQGEPLSTKKLSGSP